MVDKMKEFKMCAIAQKLLSLDHELFNTNDRVEHDLVISEGIAKQERNAVKPYSAPFAQKEQTIDWEQETLSLFDEDEKLDIPIKPPSELVFERCDAAAMRKRAGEIDSGNQELAKIGQRVLEWRVQRGKPRVKAAQELGLNYEQLQCLELGFAMPGDISEEELGQVMAILREE